MANHEFRGLVRCPMGRMSARNAHLGTTAPMEARVLPPAFDSPQAPAALGFYPRVRLLFYLAVTSGLFLARHSCAPEGGIWHGAPSKGSIYSI